MSGHESHEWFLHSLAQSESALGHLLVSFGSFLVKVPKGDFLLAPGAQRASAPLFAGCLEYCNQGTKENLQPTESFWRFFWPVFGWMGRTLQRGQEGSMQRGWWMYLAMDNVD